MSIASVLIPSDKPDGVLAANDGAALFLVAVHRSRPHRGGAAAALRRVHQHARVHAASGRAEGQRDVDRFDEFCDHLLVRDDDTGELVGCYRMLAPAGAIAAGGLYTRDGIRRSRVRFAAAVIGGDGSRGGARRSPQRRRGAADVGRHPGLPGPIRLRLRDRLRVGPDRPTARADGDVPGSQLRGVRDFILSRHAAPPQYRVRPYRPVRDRREGPRRDRAAAAAVGSGADARLPAAGRPGLRRAGARPGLRRRRLLRAAGQTAALIPDICADCGRSRPRPEMAGGAQ